jgi:hypothetical protein
MKLMLALVYPISEVGGMPDNSLPPWMRPTDPGYGQGYVPGDPGYGQGHPRPDRPENSLPIAPVRPSVPIVLPPITSWPPQIPNLPDNSLPPGNNRPDQPIHIPVDPSIGIDQPIYLPQLPAGSALLISLAGANVPTPSGVPEGHKPAILYQGAGTKPVLVYVSAAPVAAPK